MQIYVKLMVHISDVLSCGRFNKIKVLMNVAEGITRFICEPFVLFCVFE